MNMSFIENLTDMLNVFVAKEVSMLPRNVLEVCDQEKCNKIRCNQNSIQYINQSECLI